MKRNRMLELTSFFFSFKACVCLLQDKMSLDKHLKEEARLLNM